jgi:hypothetical protein
MAAVPTSTRVSSHLTSLTVGLWPLRQFIRSLSVLHLRVRLLQVSLTFSSSIHANNIPTPPPTTTPVPTHTLARLLTRAIIPRTTPHTTPPIILPTTRPTIPHILLRVTLAQSPTFIPLLVSSLTRTPGSILTPNRLVLFVLGRSLSIFGIGELTALLRWREWDGLRY